MTALQALRRFLLRGSPLALLVLAACSDPEGAGPAAAGSDQPASIARGPEVAFAGPGRVRIQYEQSPRYEHLAASIAASGIFEDIGETVTSMVALPVDLEVEFLECGEANAFYQDARIEMCYEFFDLFTSVFVGLSDDPVEIQRQVFGTGAFFFLHEMGHALVDLLGIPITGREEDSVDALATLVLLGGSEEALFATIDNFAVLSAIAESEGQPVYWGEHSLDAQRLYDIACMIYGSDPDGWDHLVSPELLPIERARRCPREYAQKAVAWDALLAPHTRR